MKILLADDHAMFRSGLRRILEEEFPQGLVTETSSCSETLLKVQNEEWDLLILDISMGEDNSLNTLPMIKKAQHTLPVLILSMHNDRQFIVQALRVGADGYLTKEHAPEELIRAIRAILQGRRYISESVAEQIAEHLAAGDKSRLPHELLSAREYEVFINISLGFSLSEIAEKLRLSVKTVSTYRARILEKTGLRSNADLMRYALRNGLVE